MKKKEIRLGLVSPIMGKANLKPFKNLTKLIKPLSKSLSVVRVYDESLKGIAQEDALFHQKQDNFITQIFYYLVVQLKISHRLHSLSGDVDVWIFYLGHKMLIPMITAKLLRKKLVLIMGSSPQDTRLDFPLISQLLIKFNLFLIDRLVVYSPSLLVNWNIEKHTKKVKIARHHFVQSEDLKINGKVKDRDNLVAYVGRLSEEKGFHNFLKAIPLVKLDDVKFIICGDGDLMETMQNFLKENSIDNVQIKGWIPNQKLASYMGKSKLIVIPSYTEGLPNTLLEAMSTGTPVLATPVGAIPDIITNGENGFLMDDNTPETIARNIEKALSSDNLDEIATKAFEDLLTNFSYQKTSKDWEKVINSLKR